MPTVSSPRRCFRSVLAAKRAGKIRFIGFTDHESPAYHLHMIDVAKRHGFTFDTVEMPLNVIDAHFESFEKRVLPVATGLDMGVIGLLPPIEMLHYGMNLPTSVVVTGIDTPEILDQAIEAATSFRPLRPGAVDAMLAKTKTVAATGKIESYATSDIFDGTVRNPHWLETATI